MRRLAATLIAAVGITLVAGCTDTRGTVVFDSTPTSSSAPDYSFGPTTTFMHNCAVMPSPAALSLVVGIPLADGTVIATGTCEYRGLNDQTNVVTLSLLTTAQDKSDFYDLLKSVGTTTPLKDPSVPGATLGPDARVFVAANNAVYEVQTVVTGSNAKAEQAASIAILAKWLQL